MISLFRAELARLLARGLTRWFPLGLAAVFVIGIGIAFLIITNDSSIDAEGIDFLDDMAGGVEARDVLGPIGFLLPLMAFVIGASYIGADIKSGMLEQILTWEPRRIRLMIARIAALLVGIGVIAAILSLFFTFLMFALAVSVGGTTGGLTGEFWGNYALILVRTSIAAGVFGIFGFAVTLLIGNSIGAIVGWIIYWLAGELILLPPLLPQIQPYLPVVNSDAFSRGVDVEKIDGSVFSGDFDIVFSHTYLVAGAIVVAYVAVALVASGIAFTRRDID